MTELAGGGGGKISIVVNVGMAARARKREIVNDASGSDSRRKEFTLPAQARIRDDPALATTSRFAEPVDDTERATLSCAARHASTAESNWACARSPSVEPCPHPESNSERSVVS